MEISEQGDAIHLEQLEITARVGVPDEERAAPQRLAISLTLFPKDSFHQLADEIAGTIDYAAVSCEVKNFAASRCDKLIETLAGAIASHLLGKFPLRKIRIELRKFILPETKFVAVILTRTQSDES